MMKKLVALLMALALLCSSIGAFATDEVLETQPEETVEETVLAGDVSSSPEVEPEGTPAPAVKYDYEKQEGEHLHIANKANVKETFKGNCLNDAYVVCYCQDAKCPTGGVFTYVTKEAVGAHTPGDSEITTKPTCTEKGVKTITCTVCNETYTEEIEALKHHMVAKKKADGKTDDVVAPTCTEQGYTNMICTRCPYEEKGNFKPATGHKWAINPDNWDVADGDPEAYNPKEDVTEDPDIPDAYVWEEKVDQDCVTDGKLVQFAVCSVCGRRVVKLERSNGMTKLDHQEWLDDYVARLVDAETEEEESDEDYAVRMLAKLGLARGTSVDNKTIPGAEYDNGTDYPGKYGDLEVTYVAGDCLTDGTITIVCAKEECGAKAVITVPALGHVYEYDKTKLPTNCLESGWVKVTCQNCDLVETVEIKAHAAHTPSDKSTWTYSQTKYGELQSVEKTADFTQIAPCQPYTTHIQCAGYTETITLGGGETVDVVVNCNKEYTVDNKATKSEHTPSASHQIKKEATCYEEGYDYYYCEFCGVSDGGKIPKDEHDAKGTEVVTKPAACETTGTKIVYCSECQKDFPTNKDKWYSTEVTIPETGHNMVVADGKEATCEKDGYTLKVCAYCGKEAKTPIPGGHIAPANIAQLSKQPNSKYSYTAATCTTDGHQSYICDRTGCNVYVENEKIPATGHSFEQDNYKTDYLYKGKYYDNYVAPTCLKDGYYERHCIVCGKNDKGEWKTQEIVSVEGTKLPHSIGTIRLDTNNLPTCQKEGTAAYKCGNPECSFVGTITLPKLPHNEKVEWIPKTKAYEVTCVAVTSADELKALLKTNKYLKDVVAASTADATKVDVNLDAVLDQIKTVLYQAKAVGGHKMDNVAVVETHYTPAIDAANGFVKLTPDANCALLEKPYITVCWNLQNEVGEIMSFTLSFNRYEMEGDTLVFDIGEFSAEGYELVAIAAVVTDARYNKLEQAQQSMYGHYVEIL